MERVLAALGYVLLRALRWPVTWWFRPSELLPGPEDRSLLVLAGAPGIWAGILSIIAFHLAGVTDVPPAVFCVLCALSSALALTVAFAASYVEGDDERVALERVVPAYALLHLLFVVFGYILAGFLVWAVIAAIIVAFAFAFAGVVAGAFVVAGVVAFVFARGLARTVASARVSAVAFAFVDAFAVTVLAACAVAGARGPALAISYAITTGLVLSSVAAAFCLGRVNCSENRSVSAATLLAVLWSSAVLLALSLLAFPTFRMKFVVVTLDPPYSFLSLAAAAMATGLPFYPAVALLQVWQCRRSRIPQFRLDDLDSLVASRWQSFAYPLPGVRRYLCDVGRMHGPEVALRAIQILQDSTMQTSVTARAALDLACDAEVGLAFSAYVAAKTSGSTLMSLALSSPLSACLVLLAGPEPTPPKESDWVQLNLPRLPSTKTPFGWRFNRPRAGRFDRLLKLRQEPLLRRIEEVMARLKVDAGDDGRALEEWLTVVQRHVRTVNLAEYRPAVPSGPGSQMTSGPAWLEPAWGALAQIEAELGLLEEYRQAATPEGRRQLLMAMHPRLDECLAGALPWLWTTVRQELVAHFKALLRDEFRRTREWLSLDVALPDQQLRVGRATLRLTVQNPTSVLARELSLVFDNPQGIHLGAERLSERQLEGRRNVELSVSITSEQPGDYQIGGELAARDVHDAPFSKRFSFRLHIGKLGRPYQRLPLSTYTAGPGVDSDRAFVGRTEILRWLADIWGTADSKEAAVLIGQRRIGKSSILYYIDRHGLEGTNLLPARVIVQSTNSPYSFLQEIERAMARAAKLPEPALNEREPFSDLTRFARGLASTLGGRRILLMIDEADLLEQQVGPSVLGLLRSLMQDPAYPVVLLFCGTHALQHMSHDYKSILFNTARQKLVSYMSKDESAEVLRRPPGDALEFDPAALAEAYRLTAGQPYLLQVLGGSILERLNREIDRGEAPDNYVDLQDMERAAEIVARQDNAAYESYWKDRTLAQCRVLSAMAAIPEEVRRATSIPDLDRRLSDEGMSVPRPDLVGALQALLEEEFLREEAGLYEFSVPLFRRWIAAKHPPTTVREIPSPGSSP